MKELNRYVFGWMAQMSTPYLVFLSAMMMMMMIIIIIMMINQFFPNEMTRINFQGILFLNFFFFSSICNHQKIKSIIVKNFVYISREITTTKKINIFRC